MASSKVMASTSSAPNSDLTHQFSFPIPPDLRIDQPTTSSAITTTATSMDDFLKNIYGDSSSSSQHQHISASSFDAAGDPSRGVAANGMDEVWKEAEMTLEDFLTRTTGAVRDDEIRIPSMPSMSGVAPPQPPPPPPPQCFGAAVNASSSMIGGVVAGVAVGNGQFQSPVPVEGFGNGGGSGGGRAKRRAVEEPVLDKVTQQKQRRMIKNRESAARSRERKQAYTVELESLVAQLEEENAHLHSQEAQDSRERFKQLMESIVPVTEKRRPPRPLRRVNSMVW